MSDDAIGIPTDWSKLRRGRSRELWNPHAPDNMLVRHLALKEAEANPETFGASQRRIRRLARIRQGMRLPDPTPKEWEEFVLLCVAAGMRRAL